MKITTTLLLGIAAMGNALFADTFYFDTFHGERAPYEGQKGLVEGLKLELKEGKSEISAEALAACKVLYLQAPNTKFLPAEKEAIIQFVKAGGSLYLVMDEESRQSLSVTEVNDIIIPFGMMLTVDTPYLHNQGGIGFKGKILQKDYEVPYSGGRAVAGGTAFAYRLDEQGEPELPFGAYKELDSGGRIVVMGEAMPSIFLGSKDGKRLSGVDRNVKKTIYFGKDSYPFMNDILSWLAD